MKKQKKIVPAVIVTGCRDCPNHFWKNDDNWMGGNGWLCCKLIEGPNQEVNIQKWDNDAKKYEVWDFDSRCPLKDAE